MTKLDATTLIRTDFASFVRKAFRHRHDGLALGKDTYVGYLSHELQKVVDGETRRLIINLPPRHLKTFIASVCLAAYVLGRKPSTRVLVVTYGETLAIEIAYAIRDLMQSSWYCEAFKTRLADDRTKVTDFATTQGGGVYAASIGGSVTGRGADLLICDDPADIGDAFNTALLEEVNARFDTKIMSRLNSPKNASVVVVAHRLNENDLSGHLIAQGGWRRVCLPMIAPRRKTYSLGYKDWQRAKGASLRPDAYSKKEIGKLRRTALAPDFETLYQQNPGGGAGLGLKREHFQSFEHLPAQTPVILSVDPGQRPGVNNSFSVVQAWSFLDGNHYLRQQWRQQCTYQELRKEFWRMWRRSSPSVVLIEATAMGPQLLGEVRRKARSAQIVEIMPGQRSKAERLIAHIGAFRKRHVFLLKDAPWREDFISEFLAFPRGEFDDQVDATTQYLDWITTNPVPGAREPRALAVRINALGQHFSTADIKPSVATYDAILSRGRR
jgi:predicted phage terminase large subunit-like protein